jgi:hypothetical protein
VGKPNPKPKHGSYLRVVGSETSEAKFHPVLQSEAKTGVILFFGVTVYASLNSRFEGIDRVVAVIRGGL